MSLTGNDLPSGFVLSIHDNQGILGTQTIDASDTAFFENVPDNARLQIDDCTDRDQGCFVPKPENLHPRGRCSGDLLVEHVDITAGDTAWVMMNIDCLPWLGWVDIEITGTRPGAYEAEVRVDAPVGYSQNYQTHRSISWSGARTTVTSLIAVQGMRTATLVPPDGCHVVAAPYGSHPNPYVWMHKRVSNIAWVLRSVIDTSVPCGEYGPVITLASYCLEPFRFAVEIAGVPTSASVVFGIGADDPVIAISTEAIRVSFSGSTGLPYFGPKVETHGVPVYDRWADGPIPDFTISSLGSGRWRLVGSVSAGATPFTPGDYVRQTQLRIEGAGLWKTIGVDNTAIGTCP